MTSSDLKFRLESFTKLTIVRDFFIIHICEINWIVFRFREIFAFCLRLHSKGKISLWVCIFIFRCFNGLTSSKWISTKCVLSTKCTKNMSLWLFLRAVLKFCFMRSLLIHFFTYWHSSNIWFDKNDSPQSFLRKQLHCNLGK